MGRASVKVRRVYEIVDEPAAADSPARVLVDRLWPRGVKRADLEGVGWMQQIAPSTELRRWYNHEVRRWSRFRERYLKELGWPEHAADLEQLRSLASERGLELITATRDVEHSAARVLADHLSG